MSELARNMECDRSDSATAFRADGMVLQFADGAIAACNPFAAELLGYTADELIGKRLFDSPRQFIHRDGTTFLPEENPALVALRSGQPCSNVTVGFYRSDGELVWLLLDSQPLFRAGESAPYAVVTTIATPVEQTSSMAGSMPTPQEFFPENRQAIARASQPETMQTSEALLRLLIKYAPACIAMFDRNMNYVALSQRWVETYQLESVEAVLGRSHYEVFPQICDRWKQAHQRGLAGEIQQCEEDSFTLPDGSVQWLRWEIRPWYTENGDLGGIVIFVEDISDRKRTEQAQRQSEERYRALIELSPQLVFMSQPDGSIIYCNQWGLEFLRRSLEELTGDGWASLVHPDHRDRVYKAWKTATTEVSDYEIEIPFRRSDGVYRWLYTRAIPVTDDTGKIAYWLGVALDISDRKQIEAALRESEHRYRTLFESMDQGFCVCQMLFDDNGEPIDYRLLEVNPAFEKMTGLEQATGKTVRQLIPNIEAFWIETYGRVVLTGEPARFENKSEAMNRWFEVNAFGVGDPQSHKFAILFTDISDRKQTEIALQKSEERLSLAIDSAGMATWDMNVQTGKIIWSKTHFTLLGYSPVLGGAATFDMWRDRVHPDDLEAVMQALEYAQQTRSLSSTEYRIILFNTGEIRWLKAFGRFLDDKNGQGVRFIGIVFDTSDRKLAELALTQSESRFRTLADNIAQLAWMTDSNGWIFWYNQRWFDYTGTTLEQMQGWGWQKVHHPDHLERVIEHWSHSLKIGEPWEDTFPLRGKDGNYRWFLSRAIPIRDEQGNVVRWFGTNTDISDRKQTEDALKESEERLRLALIAANQGLYDLNIQTGDAIVSPQYAQMLGYDPENFQETNALWLERLHPDDLQRVSQVYQEYIAGNRDQYQVEFRQRTQSGDWKWILSTGSIVSWDRDGNPLRMLGIHTDISDRKQAEEALRQSNAILNTINESTPTLIYVKDREGRMLVANPALLAVVGKPSEEILGKTSLEFHQPRQEAEKIMENDRLVMQTGQSYQFEEVLEMVGGRRVFLSVKAPYRDEQGNIIGIIGISSDISDRKLAELERERLFTRKRHYAEQLQGLTAAALAINSALSVEQVLQAIADRAAAIVGTHQSVTSLTVNDNWEQAINAVYLSDKYAQWRGYDAKPDGSGIYACVCHLNRPMRMTQAELEAHPHWRGFGKEAENHPAMRGWLAAPLVGRDGHNIGLIQLSDKYEGDFTETDEAVVVQLAQMASIAVENARLYQAEQQAREEAQTANRLKDEFLAVLSHELRSPLNPILGWTKLLQSGKLNQARTAEALTTIERNAKLQAQLIEDLLDISRIMRGKLTLNSTRVSLTFVISNALETVRLAAEAKNIQFNLALDPTVGQVLGDAGRLQQVVWNLLSNAVKFTPPGGQVTIRLTQVDSDAQIQIIDTGKGINPEFLPYVFEYFRQEDGSITRKFGGLGLGLAIARQIVEMHGGRIWADSPGVGLGAIFTLKLPTINTKVKPGAKRAIAASSPSSPKTPLTGMRILVVDDIADTRELLTFLLEDNGAIVKAVASATEALQTFAQFQPDIILSDVGMPEMDGYELMRSLRKLEAGRSIPAIALSAYAGEIDREYAIAAGFQRHLAKPIDPDRVISFIVELVRQNE